VRKNKAFTLIEVVIGVTLLSITIVAVAGLIITTMNADRRNYQSVQASYLAQEGLEIMRYIRDSNWFQNYSWDEGERTWGSNFRLSDYDGMEKEMYLKESTICPPCYSFSVEPEKIEFGNMEYTRSILVKTAYNEKGFEMENIYEIVAVIEWKDRRQDRRIEISTLLSDWK